jgi:hypothetical protein
MMVTHNPHEDVPQVENEKHQHAFVLVGNRQLFGVHMTQYHCELHKYQIILKLSLPDTVYDEFMRLRENNPQDTFVLCNAKDPKNVILAPGEVRSYSIPDIGSGRVTHFTANIFQGIRPLSPEEIAADSHFFPWGKKYAHAAIGEFEATIERIVLFRPFDHLQKLAEYARYFIFGDDKSSEVHMTNLQTASLATGPYEPQVFGPDYDHVMSLAERPDWLEQASMLEAGIVVSTPKVRLLDPQTGDPAIPAEMPFAEGEIIEALYRGIGPARQIKAGVTYLYCTEVCNSPRFFQPKPPYDSYLHSLPEFEPTCQFSVMPKRYWAFAEEED